MLDRIHWFQGWVIIALIFSGISMLVHYEDRGQEQIDQYQRQAQHERAQIRADLSRVEMNQKLILEGIASVTARQESLGLVDSWAASAGP